MSGPLDPIFYVGVSPSGTSPERITDQTAKIISIEYEDHEAKADKLTLTVDNFDLSNFDAPIWKTGNHIEVTWGYEGNSSPTRQMKIQKVTGSTQLKVECLDEGIILNKVQRNRRFDNMTRSDIAKQIATEYGFTSAQQFVDDTTEVIVEVTQARQTDANLLRDLARREHLEFWIDFQGFHFKKRDLTQKPRRVFVYYTDPGVGDIESFSVENDIYGGGKTGAVTLAGRDPLKKASFSATSQNDSETSRTTLGTTGGLRATVAGGKITYSDSEDAAKGSGAALAGTTEKTEDSAKRQASGAFQKAQMQAAILTMTCRGDPQMVAKSVIEIKGIGKTLSGNYYVTEVKHSVGAGYKMTIKCRRDGRSSAVTYGKPDETLKGKENSQQGTDTDPSKSGGDTGELHAKVEGGTITYVGG